MQTKFELTEKLISTDYQNEMIQYKCQEDSNPLTYKLAKNDTFIYVQSPVYVGVKPPIHPRSQNTRKNTAKNTQYRPIQYAVFSSTVNEF